MIYESLKNDYKNFMIAKQNNLKNCVQLVLADIKQYSVDTRKDIDDNACVNIIKKNIKQVEESVVYAEKAKNQDMVSDFKERINYLNKYLPEMLSEEDVEKQVFSLLSNESNLNKGAAMKIVMPVLKGKADGKMIANAVEKFLSKTS